MVIGLIEKSDSTLNANLSMPTSANSPQGFPSEQPGDLNIFAETLVSSKEVVEDTCPLPSRIGRFKVLSLLGSGMFGVVLLASDESLERNVAIKIPRGNRSETEIESFLSEARRTAQLQHPSIVSVYDIGREGKLCYIVTEFLEGITLKQKISSGRLHSRDAIEIIISLSGAIGHAHSRGIMHRDIKPGNVILTSDGRCVLLDFGLAVNDLEVVRGQIAGTPSYMAPEQVRGESHRVDGRTDIYALGTILYELLAGRLPFRSAESTELFRRIREDSPQPIRQLNPDLPAIFDEICSKVLSKDISARYTTAGDFAAALQSALELIKHDDQPRHLVQNFTSEQVEDSLPHHSTINVSSDSVESSTSRRLREAELRNVTILSVGFDVPARESDAESQHAMAEHLSAELRKIAEKLGGHASVSSGHEIEFCFGFPVAFEDSAARAVRCGRKILKKIGSSSDLPDRDEVFMAVHQGQAVAEETALGVKVSGEVTQTLARLMSVVESGAVVITESVCKACQIDFESEPLDEVSIRGHSTPLSLFRVTAEKRVTLNRVELVDPGNLTPLIGRDTELSILKDRWEQAFEAMGQVVLLIGEAGLGKSRLIREIREFVNTEEDEADVIELRCSQYHQSAGLYPVVEHLIQLFNFDEISSAESRYQIIETYLSTLGLASSQNVFLIASMLGVSKDGSDPVELSPQRKRDLTGELLLEVLRKRAELRPVLFIVEDLHWVDPSLLELLTTYVETFDQDRTLSLFTFRPEFETPWKSKAHQTQIALSRLTRRQINAMLQKRLGLKNVPGAVVEQISQRTDGIPLFIEEFANLLVDSSLPSDDSTTLDSLSKTIPSSLQDLLKARLDRMESNPEVIQLAAAIGREFTFKLLAAASDLNQETLESELQKLLDAEVLFQKGTIPDATFIFKHALIQDSAYDSLLKKRRQQIHSQIGNAIEKDLSEIVNQQPELLANHFTEAGDAKKGTEYWLKAAVKSQSVSADLEAVSQFEHGLKLIETMPETIERHQIELGFRLPLISSLIGVRGYANSDVQVQNDRARSLCAQIGDQAPFFPITEVIWMIKLIQGEINSCYELAAELLSLANESGDAGMLTEAYWTYNCTSFYHGDFQAAVEHGEAGLKYYDLETSISYAQFTQQNSGPLLIAHRAMALWKLGYADQAIHAMEEAIARADELKHPFTIAVTNWKAGQLYDFARIADKTYQKGSTAREISEEKSFPYFIALGAACQGAGRYHQGSLEESIDLLTFGISLIEATGGSVLLNKYNGYLAESYWKMGRREEAWDTLNLAFQQIEKNERYCEAEMYRRKGDFLSDEGDLDSAETNYMLSLEVCKLQKAKAYELRTTMRLSEMWRSQGKTDLARTRLSEVFNWFTEGFETPDLVDAQKLLTELIE